MRRSSPSTPASMHSSPATIGAFALPAEAAAWREKARDFVESELIPLELDAEMNAGRIPPELRASHERTAIEMGLTLVDVPQARGGLALPVLTQAAIVEEFGRAASALGWCDGGAQGGVVE